MLLSEASRAERPARWLWRRRRARTLKQESVCGKCHYVVTGLPDFTCPECGSDLRDVGIVKRTVPGAPTSPPLKEWPMSVRRRLRAQMLVLLPLAFVGIRVLPLWRSQRWDMTYAPKSAAYRGVTLSAVFTKLHFLMREYAEEPDALQVRLTFDALNGSAHEMWVDLPAQRMSYPTRINGPISFTTTHTAALERDDLLAWIVREVGADPADKNVQAEVDALMRVMRRFNNAAPPGTDSLTTAITRELDGPFTRGTWVMSGVGSLGQMLWTVIPLLLMFGLVASRLHNRAAERAKAILVAEGKWEDPPPEPKPAQARTLTVVFTDMKDFTARAAAASRADLVRLIRSNRQLVEGAVKRYRGRVVKTVGDGILCSFESATDAVLAAVHTQRLARAQSKTAPPADAVELRIGISTGEVTVEEDDVYGPAVNIAARIQSLATAGEVYLTDATRQAVTAAEVHMEPVGRFALKGVAGEVEVFRAGGDVLS